MTTTTAHGLPIPEETDKLGETDERIVELGEHLDDLLFVPRVYTGNAALEFLKLQSFDTGTANELALGPAGITVVVTALHVELFIDFSVAVFDPLPVADTGDIPNLVFALRMNNSAYRPIVQTAGNSTRNATRVAAYTLDPSGVIYCSAVSGSAPVTNLDRLAASFTYIRAGV